MFSPTPIFSVQCTNSNNNLTIWLQPPRWCSEAHLNFDNSCIKVYLQMCVCVLLLQKDCDCHIKILKSSPTSFPSLNIPIYTFNGWTRYAFKFPYYSCVCWILDQDCPSDSFWSEASTASSYLIFNEHRENPHFQQYMWKHPYSVRLCTHTNLYSAAQIFNWRKKKKKTTTWL